jgi:hypothetical protein
MLIILPAITFALTFLAVLGIRAARDSEPASPGHAILQAALLLGGYTALGSEVLSQLRALTPLGAGLLWGLASIVLLLVGLRQGWLAQGLAACRRSWQRPGAFDIAAAAILGVILGLLLLVAIISPANNNDSIHYHMPRVLEWAQSGSLAHFPTAFAAQVQHPIDAELMILQARLLWGTDRLANVIQWLSLVGSLVAVSVMAALFGGDRRAQWLAAAFAASIPLGLLEATSTQNDFVTAFYFGCLLFFVFRPAIKGARAPDALWIGLALGLGLLTKTTFYAYALVPLLFLAYILFKTQKFRQAVLSLLMVAGIAVVLNLGVWSRNIVSFGSPFGQGQFVSAHLGTNLSPGSLIGSLVRGVTQNLATPSERVNAGVVNALKASLGRFDPQMQGFSIEWAWNHEDLAGNPIHLMLLLATGILLVIYRRRLRGRYLFTYFLIVLASFFVLTNAIRYDFYGVRYQLPFWVALGPAFGVAFAALGMKRLSGALAIILLLAAFPWVLFNRTRPLIAMRPSRDAFTIPCLAGCTTGSILTQPPENIMFAVWGNQRKNEYVGAMDLLKSTSCKNIGLMIDSGDLEYVYWWLLDAPQSGRRLESLNPIPELRRYLDPSFVPCAIICTECGQDAPELNGMDLAGEFGKIKVYLLPAYHPEK